MHARLPGLVEYEPTGHSWHEELPPEAAKRPASHALQALSAPPENLPASQGTQKGSPARSADVPGAQGLHTAFPDAPFVDDPTGQGSHEACPATCDVVPAGQRMQEAAPSLDAPAEYFPGRQGKQLVRVGIE